eukprot:COSAG04_NODE_459_length_14010_cov_5.397311_11_plen_262_part_00
MRRSGATAGSGRASCGPRTRPRPRPSGSLTEAILNPLPTPSRIGLAHRRRDAAPPLSPRTGLSALSSQPRSLTLAKKSSAWLTTGEPRASSEYSASSSATCSRLRIPCSGATTGSVHRSSRGLRCCCCRGSGGLRCRRLCGCVDGGCDRGCGRGSGCGCGAGCGCGCGSSSAAMGEATGEVSRSARSAAARCPQPTTRRCGVSSAGRLGDDARAYSGVQTSLSRRIPRSRLTPRQCRGTICPARSRRWGQRFPRRDSSKRA